ncbi:hypothetical protein [Flavobacterium pedocola]
MKKNLFLVLFFVVIKAFSQEAPMDPLIDNENEVNNIGERITLYEIKLDGLNLPIEIYYNHNGFKATEAPGPLGLGWKFNDIGKITRILNQIPDEYMPADNDTSHAGWFYNNDVSNYNVDQTPDFFNLSTSNGLSALFTYSKTFPGNVLTLEPYFLDSNQNFTIDNYFNNINYGTNNYDDVVFDINEENGNTYSFVGGPMNQTITRNGGYNDKYTKDFYVKKIKSNHSNDEVIINYVAREYSNHHYFETGYKSSSNSYAFMTYSDYAFVDENSLEVSEIITPKERIEFLYSYVTYPPQSGYASYTLPILNEIIVKNNNGDYITRYSFEYDLAYNNRPLLSRIYKYSKVLNDDSAIKIKEFEYFDSGYNLNNYSPLFMIKDIDTHGYFNAANNTALFPISYKRCGSSILYNGGDRKPNLNAIKHGVLKKVTNNLGGVTEFDYQLNADSDYYGGGLKISKITKTPEAGQNIVTTYQYEEYLGFGTRKDNPELDLIRYSSAPGYSSVNSDLKELYDFDRESENQNMYQKTGNFFKKIISRKYIGQDVGTYFGPNEVADVSLRTEYLFRSNFKSYIRTPLLTQKDVYKDYNYALNGSVERQLMKEVRNYDLFDISSIQARLADNYQLQNCSGSYLVNSSGVSFRSIYKKEQPLRSIENYEYDNELGQILNTKKEFVYYGENSGLFNGLRIKEIISSTNNLPVSKKKINYLIEYFSPTAGLTDLQLFNNESKTLISDESNWTYQGSNGWILKNSTFYQYLSDGKIKSSSSVIKNSNNTFYSESNFTPYYQGGLLQIGPLLNTVNYFYDSNGKIEFIEHLDSKKIVKYYRSNDTNPYSINTTIEAHSSTGRFSSYRTSFENQSGTGYLDVTNAYTGKKVFTGSTLNIGTYPKKYIISYWYFKDNKWLFNSYSHGGGTVIITKPAGADYIDELWVKPRFTRLTGKTFNNYYETNNFIDNNGFTVKNIYDDYGRLIKQVDKDGNLINERTYNFIQE